MEKLYFFFNALLDNEVLCNGKFFNSLLYLSISPNRHVGQVPQGRIMPNLASLKNQHYGSFGNI